MSPGAQVSDASDVPDEGLPGAAPAPVDLTSDAEVMEPDVPARSPADERLLAKGAGGVGPAAQDMVPLPSV
jgi:hypothetical protein